MRYKVAFTRRLAIAKRAATTLSAPLRATALKV
jgi:hypothetical protein